VIPRNELNWGWLILTIARWRTPFPTDWLQWKRKPARPTTASRYTLRQEDISSWAKRTMAPTWNFQRYLLLFKLIRISVLTTVFVVAFSQAHKLSWRCLLRSEHAQAIREWMYSFSVVTQRFQVISKLWIHHFFVNKHKQSQQALFQIPAEVPEYEVPYLNIAIQRHFEDMRASPILKNEIKRILQTKLALVQHPRLVSPKKLQRGKEILSCLFQGPIVMEDVDFGPALGELFKSVKVTTSDIPNELVPILPVLILMSWCKFTINLDGRSGSGLQRRIGIQSLNCVDDEERCLLSHRGSKN